MSQKILYEVEAIKGLLNNKTILLVRDDSYKFLSVKNFFDAIPHIEFADFTPNPLYEQVVKGVKVFNKNNCNFIVAIGGGSTIDVAKCIKLYCKMDSSINYLEQEKLDTQIPLIAIPTTAGTGSESTKHAVIYFEGIKQSISHTSIVPDYAVLESSVLKTLPIYQKKCTMLDALCQAIESWWSVSSNDESKEYSKRAITGIKENWRDYIINNAAESAAVIMEAANYSGRAINITSTTAAHAMSYKITSLYKLPHGHAVAACMPEVWRYMIDHTNDCNDPRGAEYVKNTLAEISMMADLNWFKSLFADLEMNYPMAVNKEDEIETLVNSVNAVRLKNSPVRLSTETLRTMYERIVR